MCFTEEGVVIVGGRRFFIFYVWTEKNKIQNAKEMEFLEWN